MREEQDQNALVIAFLKKTEGDTGNQQTSAVTCEKQRELVWLYDPKDSLTLGC